MELRTHDWIRNSIQKGWQARGGYSSELLLTAVCTLFYCLPLAFFDVIGGCNLLMQNEGPPWPPRNQSDVWNTLTNRTSQGNRSSACTISTCRLIRTKRGRLLRRTSPMHRDLRRLQGLNAARGIISRSGPRQHCLGVYDGRPGLHAVTYCVGKGIWGARRPLQRSAACNHSVGVCDNGPAYRIIFTYPLTSFQPSPTWLGHL